MEAKKSNNSIFAFFIGLALLFWNPLSFYVIYRGTPVYTITLLKLAYAGIFILGIGAIFLIVKNRLSEKVKNGLLMLSYAGLFIWFLIAVDSIMKPTATGDEGASANTGEGLVFDPNTSAKYTTVEFDFVAEINSQGLRNEEVPTEKGNAFRILCFGDSWTYGWGVPLEKCWPKQMQAYLHAQGYDKVEVINCGRGGQYSRTYKQYIEKAVPALKPDLVVVGVLQLDDLAQLYENHALPGPVETAAQAPGIGGKLRYISSTYITYSFGNLIGMFAPKTPETIEIKEVWLNASTQKMGEFNHLQKIRFNTLADTVQSLFKTGDLRVGLLSYYIDFPDRVTIFNDPAHPSTRFALGEMGKDFAAMKAVCDANGAQLVFANMPINYFNGHVVERTPSDYLNPYFVANNQIDSMYRSVAEANALPYIELTAHFLGLEDKEAYYFRFDGHPNERGYHEIATVVGQALIDQELIKSN